MKALVIGLDSASPYLINKWIDDLPNIRSFYENGTHGMLESVVPPESVPAWYIGPSGATKSIISEGPP